MIGDTPPRAATRPMRPRMPGRDPGEAVRPGYGAFHDGAGVTHEAMQSSVYVLAMGAASPAQAQTAAASIAAHGMACSVYCAAYLLRRSTTAGSRRRRST